MHLALKRSNVRRIARRHDRRMAEKAPSWTPAMSAHAAEIAKALEAKFANVR